MRRRKHEAVRSDPGAFHRATRQLLAIPGVVGVFWGPPRRKGRWDWRKPGLAVRVEKKKGAHEIPRGEHIPRVVEGLRTDVIEVGVWEAATLRPGDWAGASSDPEAAGTVSLAVAGPEGGGLLLASGHACLPYNAAGVPTPVGPASPSAAYAGNAGGPIASSCVWGTFDTDQDWAVLETQAPVQPGHAAKDGGPSAPFHRRSAGDQEQVVHWSRKQNGRCYGVVSGNYGSVQYRLPSGTELKISGVVEVRPHSGQFALKGDSGSLVFRNTPNVIVVGVVVGVGTDCALMRDAYSLPQMYKNNRFFF